MGGGGKEWGDKECTKQLHFASMKGEKSQEKEDGD